MTWRLITFGGLALIDPEGRSVPLPGRRADALLIRLAWTPGRPVARRALVSMLWPDRDQAGGSGALRQAVHGLRRVLGARAVVSERNQIALAVGIIETDLGRLQDPQTMLDAARELRHHAIPGSVLAGLRDAGPHHAAWLADARAQAESIAAAALVRLAEAEAAQGRMIEASLSARAARTLDAASATGLGRLPAEITEGLADDSRKADRSPRGPAGSAPSLADEGAMAERLATTRAVIVLGAVFCGTASRTMDLCHELERHGASDILLRQDTLTAMFGTAGLRHTAVASAGAAAGWLAANTTKARIGLCLARASGGETRAVRIHEVDRARALTLAAGAEPGGVITEPALMSLSGADTLSGGPPGSSTRARAFIGRATELEQIAANLRAVRAQRRARLIAISGAPGIGKSRLVSEALAAHDEIDAIIVPASGSVHKTDLFGAFLVALGAASGTLARDETPMERVIRLLHECDITRAIVIEDAETLSLVEQQGLATTIDRLRDRPLLWLAAARSERPGALPLLSLIAGKLPISELLLADLSSGHTLAIAADYTLPEATRRACVERAAGNPLFLHQLLLHAGEAPQASRSASVEEAILARLSFLSTKAQATIRLASVLGDATPERALCEIGASGADVLDELCARALIRRDGGVVSLEHGLIRDTILSVTPETSLRDIHVRAAKWFDGIDPERRALHLLKAGDRAAAEALLAAARDALEDGRSGAAAELAGAGVPAARTPVLKARLRIVEGRGLAARGDLAEAALAFEKARELTLERDLQADAMIGTADLQRLQDRSGPGLAILEETEPLLEPQDCRRRAHLLVTRGRLFFAQGLWRESALAYSQSLTQARHAGMPALEVHALSGLADAAYATGDMAAADRHAQSAIDVARACTMPELETVQWAFRVHVMIYEGKLDEGEAMARRVSRDAARLHDWRAEINAQLGVASAAFCRNDLGLCAAAASRVVDLAGRTGARRFTLVGGLYHARVAIASGQIDEARRLLTKLREPLGETSPMIHAAQFIILDALAAPCEEQLRARLNAAQARACEGTAAHNALRVLPVAALLWHRLGEADEARTALAHLRDPAISGRAGWARIIAAGIDDLVLGKPPGSAAAEAAACGFDRLGCALTRPDGPLESALVC